MSSLNLNTFTSYTLEDSEELASRSFTLLNKQYLQNLLAETAQLRLNLIFDLNNPGDFCQQEAYLKGKQNLLLEILEAADKAEAELIEVNSTL